LSRGFGGLSMALIPEELLLRPLKVFFRGRTMLVTGASSGIGYDVALTLGGLGVNSALIARRRPLLDQLAARIRETGSNAMVLCADVSRRAEVLSVIDHALKELGHIDIVVNSAGTLQQGPVETMEPEQLQQMFDVNVLGTLHTIQAVLPAMRRANSGFIVNIGSLAGRRGSPPLGGYAATKFALVGLTEALRVELFGSGIHVSLIMPGAIDTPMIRANETQQAPRFAEIFRPMPARWVTWAVIAAITLRLAEVDVPPGAAAVEKLAALFPGVSDAALAFGTRLWEWVTSQTQPAHPN
jgi:NAD(P)-dependent dehydrogenase (short-subunit alcohol dehydrogenase family)